MKQVKAITFDLDGTLACGELDSKKYEKALIAYLKKIGYSGSSAKLNKSLQSVIEKIKKFQARNIEFRFELVYTNLLFDLGLEIKQERLDHIESLYNSYYKIQIFPGVKEMLEKLSKKYHLAIVANAITNIPKFALKKHDLAKYFDFIILSGDFGARKPDPEIFIYALRSMWIKADETVHVGDSLNEDVQGAKKAGMKTVWIKGNKEMTELQPDYVISKITELPNLF